MFDPVQAIRRKALQRTARNTLYQSVFEFSIKTPLFLDDHPTDHRRQCFRKQVSGPPFLTHHATSCGAGGFPSDEVTDDMTIGFWHTMTVSRGPVQTGRFLGRKGEPSHMTRCSNGVILRLDRCMH